MYAVMYALVVLMKSGGKHGLSYTVAWYAAMMQHAVIEHGVVFL